MQHSLPRVILGRVEVIHRQYKLEAVYRDWLRCLCSVDLELRDFEGDRRIS